MRTRTVGEATPLSGRCASTIARRTYRHRMRIHNTCIATKLHVCNKGSTLSEVRMRRSRPTPNLAKSQSLVDFDFRGDIPLAYDTGDAGSTKTAAYQTGVGRISLVDQCQPRRRNFLTARMRIKRANMQAQPSSARCCAKTRWGRAGWQRLTAKAYQRRGFSSEFPRPLLMSAAIKLAKTRLEGSVGGCHTPAGAPASTTLLLHVFHVANREPIAPARKRSRVRLDGNTKPPAGGMCLPSPKSRD